MKKLLHLMAALLLVSAINARTIYLNTNGIWDLDGADHFAVWHWQSDKDGAWTDWMEQVYGTIWAADIPNESANVIFCRFNPQASEPSWDTSVMWNQTNDLTIPDSANLFTITDWGETSSKSQGTWSVYSTSISEPTEMAENPTYNPESVKAVYAPVYGADCEFGEWGSGTTYTQDTFGKKFVTSNLGYLGLTFDPLDCTNMEYLHFDIWIAEDASMRFFPIWQNANGENGLEQGITRNLSAAQWNSIDIPLSEYDTITDWSSVFQIKITEARNLTFWIGNIYFYTPTTEIEPQPTDSTTCPLQGMCGDSVMWTLGCDGVLAIYGSGAMTDYDMPMSGSPWLDYLSSIRDAFVGDGVTTIGNWAFYADTNMVSVTLGKDIQVIGTHAFTECTRLTYLNLPDGVTTIKNAAFSGCYNLSAVIIPKSVKSIEEGAFAECRGLQELVCYATTPPALGDDVFWQIDKNQVALSVPQKSVAAYKAADQWSEFTNIQALPQIEQPAITIFGQDVVINDSTGTGETEVDILGDSTLVYNTEDNTLTFNNLTLNVGDSVSTAITYSGTEALTIVLNDSSTIIADTVIVSSADVIITGDGTLIAEGVVPIIGVPEANITFDSVNMYVHSLSTPAAVRRRVRGIKRVDETGGPALSGFGSADFNKTEVSPSGAEYSEVPIGTDGSGDPITIYALHTNNADGTQTILTEFTLTAIADDDDAVEDIRVTPSVVAQKVLIDGQIFILRDGKIYNLQGQDVR